MQVNTCLRGTKSGKFSKNESHKMSLYSYSRSHHFAKVRPGSSVGNFGLLFDYDLLLQKALSEPIVLFLKQFLFL
mgnify:CR=1 FL=1